MVELAIFVNTSAFLNKLYLTYDLPKIDIFNHKPDFLNILLKTAPYINQIKHAKNAKIPNKVKNNYHIFLSISDFLSYKLNLPENISSHIKTFVLALENNRHEKYQFYVRYHGAFEGIFAKEMVAVGKDRISAPGIFAGLDVTQKDIKIFYKPKKNKLNLDNYITVHDGCDVTNPIIDANKKSTKQWPQEYWNILICMLKKAYPDLPKAMGI